MSGSISYLERVKVRSGWSQLLQEIIFARYPHRDIIAAPTNPDND